MSFALLDDHGSTKQTTYQSRELNIYKRVKMRRNGKEVEVIAYFLLTIHYCFVSQIQATSLILGVNW